MGFLIHKVWQILKRFSRQLSWAQTSYFWRVRKEWKISGLLKTIILADFEIKAEKKSKHFQKIILEEKRKLKENKKIRSSNALLLSTYVCSSKCKPNESSGTMCDFHNFGLIFMGQCTVCLKG